MNKINSNSYGYNKNSNGFFIDHLAALNKVVQEYDYLINEILIDFLRLIDSTHANFSEIALVLPNHLRLNNPKEPLSSILCHCHHQIYGMYSGQGSLAIYKRVIQYIINSNSLTTKEQIALQENIAFADNVVEKIAHSKENYILFRDHLKHQQNKPMSTHALTNVLRMFLREPCEQLLFALAQTSDHYESKNCHSESVVIRGLCHRIFGFGERVKNQLKLAYVLFERQNKKTIASNSSPITS